MNSSEDILLGNASPPAAAARTSTGRGRKPGRPGGPGEKRRNLQIELFDDQYNRFKKVAERLGVKQNVNALIYLMDTEEKWLAALNAQQSGPSTSSPIHESNPTSSPIYAFHPDLNLEEEMESIHSGKGMRVIGDKGGSNRKGQY